VDEGGGETKETNDFLSLSLKNSYYRDRLKETSDTLCHFIVNKSKEW
jgi:hypothetical protein